LFLGVRLAAVWFEKGANFKSGVILTIVFCFFQNVGATTGVKPGTTAGPALKGMKSFSLQKLPF